MSAGRAWAAGQRRKTSVRRVCYAATDELARGAYWAEVLEWGPGSAPARFDIQVADDNSLSVEMSNVGVLAVDLLEAPADRGKPVASPAPRLEADEIVAGRLYRIACTSGRGLADLTKTLKQTPAPAQLADTTWRMALKEYLARHPELLGH